MTTTTTAMCNFDALVGIDFQILIEPSYDEDGYPIRYDAGDAYCWLPSWIAGNLLGCWQDDDGDTVLVVPYQGRFYNVPVQRDGNVIVVSFNNFLFPMSGFLKEFGLEKYIHILEKGVPRGSSQDLEGGLFY